MRRQSDDYVAIPARKRLARRRQAQRATRASRPLFSLLKPVKFLSLLNESELAPTCEALPDRTRGPYGPGGGSGGEVSPSGALGEAAGPGGPAGP
jgi:hypothetical protein